MRDEEGEPKAAIFTFAYTKDNVSEDEVRPVTFTWNGGPGSASLWLHMGTFGPKRVVVPSDAGSIAEFIRDWVTEHGRWNSPKFLMRESFGTTRAAAVANLLEGRQMLALNGIVLISQALDYAGSTRYVRDNLISYVTYVPTMAATALYHDRVEPRPERVDEAVRGGRVAPLGVVVSSPCRRSLATLRPHPSARWS